MATGKIDFYIKTSLTNAMFTNVKFKVGEIKK